MEWKFEATEAVGSRAQESLSERAGFARTHSGNSNEQLISEMRKKERGNSYSDRPTGRNFVEQLGAGQNDDGDRDRTTLLALGLLAKLEWNWRRPRKAIVKSIFRKKGAFLVLIRKC